MFISNDGYKSSVASLEFSSFQVIVMLTSALQKKWILQWMVLIYLFLSFGTANAAFWCHTDEDSSHLKVNPIGKCLVNCSADSELPQQGSKIPQSANLSFSLGDDCLDSLVFTSALPTSKLSTLLIKNSAASLDTTYLSHAPGLNLGGTHLARRTPPGHLPEHQTLQVLRTVVLLR
ncbi:hypothetical protein [Pelovirga terrestris]|uniref:Uncharacterized protein n=1 Tax=Pelovirga terrestris TaxID=2771352 RepID=A0A8J6QT86_9BACT|nr:hypothetical protein [Pelovirga terrestris]MBD1401605.1 hypothetical protein [Pelovirga terrestris]